MEPDSFQNPFLGDPQFALPLNNAAWGGQPPAQAPTAVLVSDLTELLEPMFEELQENTDSIKGLVKGVNEIRDRLKSLERAARGHSGDEGDGDEPGVNGGSSNPKKRRRTTRTADPTKPQGDVLHHLQVGVLLSCRAAVSGKMLTECPPRTLCVVSFIAVVKSGT